MGRRPGALVSEGSASAGVGTGTLTPYRPYAVLTSLQSPYLPIMATDVPSTYWKVPNSATV